MQCKQPEIDADAVLSSRKVNASSYPSAKKSFRLSSYLLIGGIALLLLVSTLLPATDLQSVRLLDLTGLLLLTGLTFQNRKDALKRTRQIQEMEGRLLEARQQQYLSDYLQQLATRLAEEGDCAILLPRIVEDICGMGYAACALLLRIGDSGDAPLLAGELVSHLESMPTFPLCLRKNLGEIETLLRQPIRSLSDPMLPTLYDASIIHCLRSLEADVQLNLPISYQGEPLGILLVWASMEVESPHSAPGSLQDRPDVSLSSAPMETALFDPAAMRFFLALANHVALALGDSKIHLQMLEAHKALEQQHQEEMAQTEQLLAMNGELIAVQNELQAQYLALETANSQLAALATTDGMTGLANHRRFQEEVARQIARGQRTQSPLSLLLLDVDHFKSFNDTFGHPAGDLILKQVGRILREIVREGDFPARYGGEEFAVVLPDTDVHTASQVAERIRFTVASENFPHRAITVSIGVTQSIPGEAGAILIQRADVALYEAKTAGRNHVSVFAPSLSPGSEASLEMTAADDAPLRIDAESNSGPSSLEAEGHSSIHLGTSSDGELQLEAIRLPFLEHTARDGGLEGLLQEPPAHFLAELLALLDRRHVQPLGHSVRVARYALRLARELTEYYEEQRPARPLLPRLTSGDMTQLTFGALLHDIGKSGVPDEVLRKSGELTENEWRQIRRHPLVGIELIASSPLLSRAIPVVRFHHERWDGTGYPQGLAQESIPLTARIFAVCNTLDTLLTGQTYRPPLSYEETRDEIVRGSGSQFDPDVVQAFLRVTAEEWLMDLTPCSQMQFQAQSLRRAA